MRASLAALLIAIAAPAFAQTGPQDAPDPDEPIYTPETPPDVILPPGTAPALPPQLDGTPRPGEGDNALETPDGDVFAPAAPDLAPAPDYSALPPAAEREARLVALFDRLRDEEDVERAKLVSEEIWALWMDSGSASVNYLLTRADEAQRKGQTRKARRFLDLMTGLEPDFAEAYARSARLALDEENYSRAVADASEALIREPRHFYAMWTLGNVLERIGKSEAALEVYEEAHALFPLLGGVKDRLDALRGEVLGDVL